MKRVLLFTSALLIGACSDNGSSDQDAAPPDQPDAHVPDAVGQDAAGTDAEMPDASAPSAEVGTGVTEFNALADRQLVPFIQGPQGGGACEGYHLWGAVKVRNMDTSAVRIVFRYLRASDRNDVIAFQERVLPLQPAGGGAYVAYGFAPRLKNCCLIVGDEIVMRVEVDDQMGHTASDERVILVPGQCIDEPTGQSVCPRNCP